MGNGCIGSRGQSEPVLQPDLEPMSLEQAYMIKKQLGLNLHRVSVDVICAKVSPLILQMRISLEAYSSLLARLGLLNEDFPQSDQ